MIPIGEVARRAGVRTSAIRYWERLGLLPRPGRESGRRRYDEDVLLRLNVIRFARDSGFALREIAALFAGRPYSERLRSLARDKIAELEQTIERTRLMQTLLRHALSCRCLTLEECGRRLGGSVRTSSRAGRDPASAPGSTGRE
jgi:MerR family redox-sensitive transcriptional activator SoxR